MAVTILLVVIVVGAGAYFFLSSTTTSSPSSSSISSTISSTTSTSCTTPSMNLTASGSPQGDAINFSRTFASFSEMAVQYNGTAYDGNTPLQANASSDYHVISTTASGYKVNVTLTSSRWGNDIHFTDFVLKNGSALWVYAGSTNTYLGIHAGDNYTGIHDAVSSYEASMYFFVGNFFGAAFIQLTSSGDLHMTGTGTVMLGPTQVSVTDYAPNALPLKANQCGTSVDLTRFSLQTGTVSGTPGALLTLLNIAGSFTINGYTHSANLSYRITSITR